MAETAGKELLHKLRASFLIFRRVRQSSATTATLLYRQRG